MQMPGIETLVKKYMTLGRENDGRLEQIAMK